MALKSSEAPDAVAVVMHALTVWFNFYTTSVFSTPGDFRVRDYRCWCRMIHLAHLCFLCSISDILIPLQNYQIESSHKKLSQGRPDARGGGWSVSTLGWWVREKIALLLTSFAWQMTGGEGSPGRPNNGQLGLVPDIMFVRFDRTTVGYWLTIPSCSITSVEVTKMSFSFFFGGRGEFPAFSVVWTYAKPVAAEKVWLRGLCVR